MALYEDEIDLRPYILALIHNWWRITLVAVVFTSVALGFSVLQAREYIATATILLTRSQASLNLAEQFPTVRENIYDPVSRMNALLTIAQSDAIALETLDSVSDKLPADERELEAIKDQVEVADRGDSILVSAFAQNPELAAEIANTWAHRTILAINQAYSGGQPLAEIQRRSSTAKQEYEDAQSALESFIRANQITLFQKKIEEANNLLSEAVNDRAWQISYYYNRKQSMQDLKVKAEALKQQLGSGKRSSAGGIGDAIALLNMHSNAFGIGETSNARALWLGETSNQVVPDNTAGMTFDLQLTELSSLDDTPASYAQDLDRIIQQAESEISKSEEALNNLNQNLFQGEDSDVIEATSARIQELQTRLENEQARQRELASNRDLAWEAYQALIQKETEIENAAQTSNQVTLASRAIPPQNPASRGIVRNALLAGVLGGLLGIFRVFGIMWWKSLDRPSGPESSITTFNKAAE
jgi:uncharacterized protein involved in exopolysaccharide biosynthesis